MRCTVCGSVKCHADTATVTTERNGATVVVRGVPAERCDECGEEYVDFETTVRVFRASEVASRQGALVVRDFAEAR